MTTTTIGVAYQRVIDQLRSEGKKVRESRPGQAIAQCPAHDDGNPSLSVTGIESQALIYCHAGCPTEAVLDALGLAKRDLYDEPRGSTYIYEDGRTVHRDPDKKFRQSGNTNGQTTLYRLSKVQNAVAGAPVFLVEGEKDVHAIETIGFVATTAPMGAKNFHKVDVTPLTGANVVAVMDKDDAGREWASQVQTKLAGVAAQLTFWRAPGALKDAADCIAAYGNLDNLEPIEPPAVVPEAEPESVQSDESATGGRQRVEVSNAALAADWLRNELGRGELAGIFRRGSELVHTPRVGEEGYLPAVDLGMIDAGPAQVRIITTVGVKALVETHYECWRWVVRKEESKAVAALFPQQSAQSACEAARLGEYAPNLRVLRGVTHTPMMRPDGTVLDTPGYDAATGFLYLPDSDLVVPPIPTEPTLEEVQAAVDLILMPIAEFPFVSDDDRATWIGLLFTPALRPLLRGPYQMGVITATNPGSGKTLLTKMIGIVHGGAQRGELPREAAELKKAITATLIDTTAPVVTWDNLTGVIRSSVLESLLTSDIWSDRFLGQSRDVSAPNDRLWLATGNNAAFGGDLARRITTVALDPPEANHHLRTDFKIKDLNAWMREHRGELLAAILTVARGWVVAGRPAERVRSDDYAPWVGGLRGLMGRAGLSGTFGGGTSTVAMSADDEEWHAFLVALDDAFGVEPFTVKQLVERLDSYEGRIDSAVLPGDLAQQWSHIRDGKDAGFKKSLGLWLKNRVGRYVAGWSVIDAGKDSHANVVRYRVKPPADREFCGSAGVAGESPLNQGIENSNNTGGGTAGQKSRNSRTPADSNGQPAESGGAYSRCQTCDANLIGPVQRQRGLCGPCLLKAADYPGSHQDRTSA